MYESQNFMMADSQNWLFYPTKPLQKELGFLLQNCGTAQFLKFFAIFGQVSSQFLKIMFFGPFWRRLSLQKDQKIQKLRAATILQQKSQFLLQWLSWVE